MKKCPGTVGHVITVVSIVILLLLFWGTSWFANMRTNFFSLSSDDCIKDLYTTTWHAAHDDDATWCHAMNYPYGEYYTFTGLHPLVAMPLQWLRQAGVEHTERAVLPLMNFFVMLSVVLCALFLYMTFLELGLPWWYAVLSSLLVTLMSPQLQRMGGHISLSYYCVIPMLLYFTVRHLQSYHWGWALAVGLCSVLAGLCHPYYFVFFITVAMSELLLLLYRLRKKRVTVKDVALSALLQVVLPITFFVLLTHIGMDDQPRTAVPKDYFNYQGRLAGVLFPYGRLYFYEKSKVFSDVGWESRSYVGIVAVVAIVVLVWRFLLNLFRRRYGRLLRPTDNAELNFLLLSSTLLLLYACGVPLFWLPRNVVTYIGPLAQIRALGRLAWLFYYVINLVAFYGLYRWWRRGASSLRPAVVVMAFTLLAAEAAAYNWHNKDWYNNSWPAWTDYDNQLPENQWVMNIDASSYQAILTLPVFNTGSDMIWVGSRDMMFANSALLSLKTGLPLVCQQSARSVIPQAWNCVALSRTAWMPLQLADEFPGRRPLLLAVTPEQEHLNEAERKLLSHATPLMNLEQMSLYSLPIEAFKEVMDETRHELKVLYDKAVADSVDGFFLNTDTIRCDIHSQTTLFDDSLTFGDDVEISYWMSPVLKDQYSRSTLKIRIVHPDGSHEYLYGKGADEILDLVDTRNDEGLFRFRCTLPSGGCHLQILIRNREMRPSPAELYNLLIRPTDVPVAINEGGNRYINNIKVL